MLYPSFPGCLDRYYPDQEPPEIMSPSSSIAGDHIGLESCTLDTIKTAEGGDGHTAAVVGEGEEEEFCYFSERVRQRREERREMRRREYPPPIPLLTRTENLPSHMPWVLRRYHTSDGRLILREEKVRHHEYLRAHRADGRLTLHLVPMDHIGVTTLFNEEEGCDEHDTSVSADESDHDLGYDDGGEEDIDGGGGGDRGLSVGAAGKCLAYSGNGHHHVGPSCKCIFGVPISPIRPVHS